MPPELDCAAPTPGCQTKGVPFLPWSAGDVWRDRVVRDPRLRLKPLHDRPRCTRHHRTMITQPPSRGLSTCAARIQSYHHTNVRPPPRRPCADGAASARGLRRGSGVTPRDGAPCLGRSDEGWT